MKLKNLLEVKKVRGASLYVFKCILYILLATIEDIIQLKVYIVHLKLGVLEFSAWLWEQGLFFYNGAE